MTHALIIDDDCNNLGVLQQLLTMQGITYTAIQDPTKVEEALAELDEIGFVLLDLEMPDFNGYQLFDILKSSQQLQAVPIIACTVHTNELYTARSIGFDGFISKPLNVDKFKDQLDCVLRGESVWYGY